MGTMVNSVDPDEMQHKAAYCQGLHCLLTKSVFRERNIIYLESIACNPSLYTMKHPDLTVSNLMENFIGLKWKIPLVLKGNFHWS